MEIPTEVSWKLREDGGHRTCKNEVVLPSSAVHAWTASRLPCPLEHWPTERTEGPGAGGRLVFELHPLGLLCEGPRACPPHLKPTPAPAPCPWGADRVDPHHVIPTVPARQRRPSVVPWNGRCLPLPRPAAFPSCSEPAFLLLAWVPRAGPASARRPGSVSSAPPAARGPPALPAQLRRRFTDLDPRKPFFLRDTGHF